MNKKLLFGIMSLAALAACTNDDFDSQQQVAEQTSPIQFEVINNDASMRATLGTDDAVVFSGKDGDLFTLYHGAAAGALTGYQNATYTSSNGEGAAVLTTPSVILPGSAIMVWPADTTFSIKSTDNLSFSIPADQPEDIENYIPYASDLIQIAAYADYNAAPANAYNKAGKDRKYPVYMRTMASLLKLKADYDGTDKTLESLYTGDDAIDPIAVKSVQLITKSGGTTEFTTKIPVTFTAASAADNTRWNTTAASKVPNNAWSHVTGVDRTAAVATSATLTTECLDGNSGCKFIILPQPVMSTVAEGMTDDGTGVEDGGVVVNTIYGKVVIQDPAVTGTETKYTAGEIAGAWYRYVSAATAADEGETKSATAEASGDYAGKYKVTSKPEFGLQQTLNAFGKSTAGSSKPTVETEYCGAVTTRFVKVLLTHLDMTDLHITSDKQLRDAAKVWKKMNLDGVTVYLDGDANNEFAISQKTVAVINDVNTGKAVADQFHVKPCNVATHKACNTIVITGGGNVPEDLTFIEKNGAQIADVAFNAGEEWKWNGAVKTLGGSGLAHINSFINRGTMKNDADATLKVTNSTGVVQKFVIPFENAEGAIWNITAGTLRVQFNVTNNGTVNISKGAQYRQDGQSAAAKQTTFTNQATTLPNRITGVTQKIGVVNNEGVFATVGEGIINNYGLIEHAYKDAMTFITANETTGAAFGTAFGAANKMGQINLPYGNKDEDNISISAAAAQGFVSVTVNGEDDDLDEDEVGTFVNYIIVKSGVETISELPAQIKYVEINQPGTRIEWNLKNTTTAPVKTAQYDGLIVKSDVNIKLGTTIAAGVTYLGADMYVAGVFNKAALTTPTNTINAAATNWAGYYGDTSGEVATKYITF